ncbi:hypothetical protein ACM26V_05925 [Salipaludibacillus sp. HK11]|uniref:hypothetical protein n=1 Tax=Salipaludibacillus sp. HK11 TaxID=3394320 RepID=UPI0039FD9942
MQTEHDLILLMKKHPEVFDFNFSFLHSFTSYTKKMTQLIYENDSKQHSIVYFFHEPVSEVHLGKFFDDLAQNIFNNTGKTYMIASRKINEKYKKLFDHFQINWFELNENNLEYLKGTRKESSPSLNENKDESYRNNMILFAESILSEDLNTSWADFSLLVSDKELSVEDGIPYKCKKRPFQIYVSQQLRYDGELVISYESYGDDLKIPRYLRIYLNRVNDGDSHQSSPFLLTLDLDTCFDVNTGILYTDVSLFEQEVGPYDLEKINVILQKWNLDTNDSFKISDFKLTDLDYLIRKLISLSMLMNGVDKKKMHYV